MAPQNTTTYGELDGSRAISQKDVRTGAMAFSVNSALLGSFRKPLNIAVIGASGGIGSAVTGRIASDAPEARIYAFSRRPTTDTRDNVEASAIDLENETSIADAAELCRQQIKHLSATFVVTGLLHDGEMVKPEKSWKSLRANSLEKAFRINAVGPALVAKHFLPLMRRDSKSVFACLSARVGSIEDNRLGGWYGYRASKAALNMIIKTLSIELARSNPKAVCVGLHPGTVDTALSKPFQRNVRPKHLFTPDRSALALLAVVDNLMPTDTGKIFAWDGEVIPY